VREFGGFEIPRILLPAQIARLGLTPARIRTELRRGNWQRLAVGVLLTRPDEPTRDDWAHVGVHLAGRSSALAGWDAVRVRGLGARNPPDSTVLVVTRRGANRVVGGVRIRRTSRPFARSTLPADHPTLALVPIVAVERAIADTALACTDLGSVRALITAAVQRRNVILSDIVAELDAGPA
jgi:hypothetical protein